jgi:hypothetical protein
VTLHLETTYLFLTRTDEKVSKFSMHVTAEVDRVSDFRQQWVLIYT